MDHLWTPWRSKYIQEPRGNANCIFCTAANGTEDDKTLVVHRGDHCFVLLNRYPYTAGHAMVAPYVHVSRLTQADDVVTAEMMRIARRLEQILEQLYHPNGMNLGLNLGEAAGAGIEQHIHLHVLPRWIGDANFMTTVAQTRVLPELLEDTYIKFRAAFTTS
jgi:ATP adenylyltransferase